MHATRRYYQTMLRFFLSHSCLEIVQLIICFVSVYKSIMDSNLHSYTLTINWQRVHVWQYKSGRQALKSSI